MLVEVWLRSRRLSIAPLVAAVQSVLEHAGKGIAVTTSFSDHYTKQTQLAFP